MAAICTYATPSRLYRYRALTHANVAQELAAIREKYIFCPRIGELNDPMEGLHRESSMFRRSPNRDRILAQMRAAKHDLGVASFSETHRHEPMWAYYAGKFSGICVAYSLRLLLRALPEDHSFVRMFYSEKAPMLSRGRSTPEERARMVLSAKTFRWAGEREWRLIRPERGPAVYAPTQCVTHIYLGSRIDPAIAEQVSSVAELLEIPVDRMNVDQYSLSFRNIADAGEPDE